MSTAISQHPRDRPIVIEQALAALGHVRWRSPYAYASTWPLEEVELTQRNGTPLRLLIKRMRPTHASKPPHICDPTREVEAYELLEPERMGTPRCHASGRWWLILEKVTGVELWQRGDLDAWQDAARWAAHLHRRFAGEPPAARRMLRHDETLHRPLFASALARIGKPLEELRGPCEVAIARLQALPRTVIHGELYASNVLVGDGRIAAVDWEMIAHGPGVIDLAALVTGWEGDDRREILAAYGGVDEADLAAAQLLLALQWLGWAPDWQAPPEHRRDWFSEARAAANMLE